MAEAYELLAAAVLLSVAAGFFGILRGPTAGDRMLAVQLAGTGGVAVLLLLSRAMGSPDLVNAALGWALLAAAAMIAFALLPGPDSD
jgi:multicomponent Na+:H+ antiporter subunit F